MTKYSRSPNRVEDPYVFMALQVIHQALREIKCYYTQRGRDDEIVSGYKAISWITNMEGNYKLFAGSVSYLPLDKVHQYCLAKINTIKKEAYERQRMEGEPEESKLGGVTDIEVVSIKKRSKGSKVSE